MKKLILIYAAIVCSMNFYGQNNVGVNTTNPDASAVMHIEATDRGLLIPRMDSLGMTLITSPANGLMIYNLTDNAFWYYEVNKWTKIGGNTGVNSSTVTSIIDTVAWKLRGNSGTNPSTNFIGTTDAQDFVIRTDNTERIRVDATGNVGLGTSTPAVNLDVGGEVKLGNSGIACSAVTEGAIRYNSTTKVLEFCDGVDWISVPDTNSTATQWQLIDVSDFETTTLLNDGWTAASMTRRTSTGMGSYMYRNSNTPGSSTHLTKSFNLSGIPHTQVKVVFRFWYLDSWDGSADYARLNISTNGISYITEVWRGSWHTGNGPLNPFAFPGAGGNYNDYYNEERAIFRHNTNDLHLRFSSPTVDRTETWGIDNIEVWVR